VTENPRAPLVEIRDFGLRLGGKDILRDVSFEVADGEYVSIIGPNGAGKTTLLKCIMRILSGGTGGIRVAGRALGEYAQRDLARLVGYVPQADGRIFPFTVREFVMMGRYPHLSPFSSTSPDDEAAAARAMEMTGCSAFADRQLDTLSGGERQGAFVAAALAQGARLLLLDEPTTFLDPLHEANISRVLRRVNREGGVTVVAVTHDVNAAALRSDRVVALVGGSVAFSGPGRNLMTNEVLESVYGKRFVMVEHPTTRMPVTVPDASASDSGPGTDAPGPDGGGE